MKLFILLGSTIHVKYKERTENTCRESLTVWYCAKRQSSISNLCKGSRSSITGVSVTCDCNGDALCLTTEFPEAGILLVRYLALVITVDVPGLLPQESARYLCLSQTLACHLPTARPNGHCHCLLQECLGNHSGLHEQ